MLNLYVYTTSKRVLVPSTREKSVVARKEAKTKVRLERGSNEIFNSVREIQVEDDELRILPFIGGLIDKARLLLRRSHLSLLLLGILVYLLLDNPID